MATSAPLRSLGSRIHGAGPDDRGDIVLGWLTRVVVLLALISLGFFEGISLVTSRINGTDVANQIAIETSEAYLAKGSVKAAKMTAETEAAKHGAEIVKDSVKVTKDGTVTLLVRSTATTLLLYRTKPTAKWTVIVSSGHGRSVAP